MRTFHLRSLLAPACSLALAALYSTAPAADVRQQPDPYAKQIHSAPLEAKEAIAKFKVPEGFKVDLYASEPEVVNPVVMRVDNKDNVYVIETFRHTSNVLDIREHMNWLNEDIGLHTVQDRLNLLRKEMGPKFANMTKDTDRIRFLADPNHTGHATKTTIFATGFNSAEAGIAAGILPFNGNVYLADIPGLYLLKDTNGDGIADVRKELITGFGVHISFLGHDLHGLRVGPDRKLYFSIGDRGTNAKSLVDGSAVDLPGTGAVFRCNLDGSHFETFAYGLRNPQQLVFDDEGNLFAGDNNPDYGDPARWVYVVEGGDSGWRESYQSARLHQGGGPWMWEQLYQEKEKLHDAAYMIPPIAHLGAGPSDVAYYPGTGMSDKWNGHFFMVDFRGGSVQSRTHTFKMQEHGATFELVDREDFLRGMLATGMDFSTHGGIYFCDWVEGWNKPFKGRVYHVYEPSSERETLVVETGKLLAEGFEHRTADELSKLLAHPDIRVRQEAQFALADKGESSLPLFTQIAQHSDNRHARFHAIWGIGELGEKTPTALDALLPLLTDRDSEVRAQAAKTLGEDNYAPAFEGLTKLLSDPDSRPRFFAAIALGRLKRPEATAPLLEMLRQNGDRDAHLRHAGIMGLVGCFDQAKLMQAAHDSSPSVRMGVLLTFRRLKMPEIAMFLHDSDPHLVSEAVHAINDVPIDAATSQLAAMKDDSKLSEPEEIRVLNANFRLGGPQGAKAVADYAANPKGVDWLRVEALKMLGLWAEPGDRDWVMNDWRPLPKRSINPGREAAGVAVSQILHPSAGAPAAPDRVRVAALNVVSKLKLSNVASLSEMVADAKYAPDVRAGALEALADREDPKLASAVKVALKDKSPVLREAAILALAKLPDGTPQLQKVLDTGSTTDQQAALSALGTSKDKAADEIISKSMDKLLAGQWKPELTLDLYEAAAKKYDDSAIQDKYNRYKAQVGTTDPMARYRMAEVGGNAEEGRRIFRERADASCIRCHTVNHEGGIVGPVLDGIGARQNREYLLESIVFPNAKIAPGFESAAVKLKDNKVVVGVVKSETGSELTLMDADGKLIRINKNEIAARKRGPSAMPEGFNQMLSLRDLRNLVEFLASLKQGGPGPASTK